MSFIRKPCHVCVFSTNVHEHISFLVQFVLPVMHLTSGPVISSSLSKAPANTEQKHTHTVYTCMQAGIHTQTRINDAAGCWRLGEL